MSQLSFASLPVKHKPLKMDIFLSEMDRCIPWTHLVGLIKPYYYNNHFGRRPMPIKLMLGIYFLQQWYQLGDPAVEERIYDSNAFQRFLKLDVFNDVVPDETTILNFRHLLEKHGLTEKIFRRINLLLKQKGFLLKQGSLVDATIVNAPSSTKNKEKKRDPEMSSTKKNGQWHFGMKMHIGVDAHSGLIHSLEATTAKTPDCACFPSLLHGEEKAVFGDKGYVNNRDKHFARQSGVFWGVLDKACRGLSSKQKKRNRKLSSIRSKVEHPFLVIKHLWNYRKTRYKGLLKNQCQFFTLAALANLYKLRKKISYLGA